MAEAEPSLQQVLIERVIRRGLCVGCGACLADVPPDAGRMERRPGGPVPEFTGPAPIGRDVWEACPGKGVDYPRLYAQHYGGLPDDWRLGVVRRLWVGHAGDPEVRRAGASGGVLTAMLIHLLESGRVDAAVLARQGLPRAEEASFFIARDREGVRACTQSVYAPLSMLDALREFRPGERYAITCLPEQSAALRVLQHAGHARARQVRYVLGPYTGTGLELGAVRALLWSHGVHDRDAITSLQWRAGEWPGQLEIHTASGRVVRSKKVHYNYLIPFYATRASLQGMDFANEFADLAVGDAWSPRYERLGQGFSVVAARTAEIESVVEEMVAAGALALSPIEAREAAAMHGHMIDFKKRGGYLRNAWRRRLGLPAADIGLRPVPLGAARALVEIVVSALFVLGRTAPARALVRRLPEAVLGPLFDRLRRLWKEASKPVKRRGLAAMRMETYTPSWRRG